MATTTERHVVLVKSRGPRGRIGLVSQEHVKHQPNGLAPSVSRLGEELVEVTFPEADEPVDGMRRRFWATSVEGEVFRELLGAGFIAEPHGSLSAFRVTQSTPEARALVNRAIDHIALALSQQSSDG